MQKVTLFRSALGVFCFAFMAVQAGEMTEAQKRTEFAKAYASAKPEDRVAAVQLLKGTKEPVSLSFLSKVAATDVESAVRLSAFNLISDWDDPLAKLEPVILELYRSEKNRPTKILMIQVFGKLKTKTAATEETIGFLNQLVYPPSYDENQNNNNNNNNNSGNKGGPGVRRRTKEEIDALRKDFADVLAVVNTLTGQSFSGDGDKVKEQVKKWWLLHKNDFLKTDAEVIVKLRDEAQAAALKQTASTKPAEETKK